MPFVFLVAVIAVVARCVRCHSGDERYASLNSMTECMYVCSENVCTVCKNVCVVSMSCAGVMLEDMEELFRVVS